LLRILYSCSIVFEPLLFFVLFDRSFLGITGNLSRILQIIVVFVLLLRLLIKLSKGREVRLTNFTSPVYNYLALYFLLLIFSGLIALATGAYYLPEEYQQGEVLSEFSALINSLEIRPLFEYIITTYLIIYFVILPKYLLNNRKDITTFLTIFKFMFVVSLIIGFIDYYFLALFDVTLVPRHINDGIDVGLRYHGLAGEPRQATLYLVLGLAILHLKSFFEGEKLSKWWIGLIIIALLLTQSTSGLLGCLAFLGLYLSFNLFNAKHFFAMLFVILLTIFSVYMLLINSDRVVNYIDSARDLWFILESGGTFPYLMKVQADNIYPLYDLTVKFREFDFIPILIGSGLGSASIVNNIYAEVVFGTSNPNSQLVRLLYESGLIGSFFFVMAFIRPVKYLSKGLHSAHRHQFLIYVLLVLGFSLGIRSPVIYIYLGVFIAAFSVLSIETKDRYTV